MKRLARLQEPALPTAELAELTATNHDVMTSEGQTVTPFMTPKKRMTAHSQTGWTEKLD